MTEETKKKRILVTGAAGRIGSAFRHYVGDRYQLRLAYHRRSIEDPGSHEVIALDIADLDACRAACAGMDVVVHMAADPSPWADFYGSLLPNNIQGPYNVLQAAKDAGCQRVILASSVQVVDGYPVDVQVHPDMPVWPSNLYGAAKCFTEGLARAFSSQGLSCLVIRIGSFDSERLRQVLNPYRASKFVSARDMSQLIMRCVEAPDELRFALLHGVSNNRFKRLDLTSTRALVGYDPQDDAFAMFGDVIQGDDLWAH